MCVSETWINQSHTASILEIPNYHFFHKDRSRRGGGVGIYIRDEFSSREVFEDFHSCDGIEHIFVEVTLSKIKILLCVIYRVPSSSAVLFIEQLDNIMSFVTPQYDYVGILGDINIDLLQDHSVLDCISSYDFVSQINEPTRITPSSATCIDVIFTNSGLSELVAGVGVYLTDDISDHHAIFCHLKLDIIKTQPKIITYRDFKNFSKDLFLEDLNLVPWYQTYYMNNIEDKISFLTTKILQLFEIHAPVVRARITKPYAPWLTPNLKKMMSERDKALRNYKRTRDLKALSFYRQLRNSVVNAVRLEKKGLINYHLNHSDSKTLWKAFKSSGLVLKNSINIPQQFNDVNAVNRYFASVFSPPNCCPNALHYYSSSKLDESLNFEFSPVSEQCILDVIMSLQSNTPGSDGISAVMVKHCLPTILLPITHIINCCLEVGYFPNAWKMSVIKPLPKIKNVENFSDLRPISHLPVLSKILEKIVRNQMCVFLSDNGLLPQCQSGFRQGYSTVTALAQVTDDIIKQCDEGNSTALVLLDFSKAFDTIDHELLVAKLFHYGLSESCLQFFQSYLMDREQVVKIEDEFSKPCPVTSGVPQGSILGPILFLIYTADLHLNVSNSSIVTYADDTQLYMSFNSNDALQAVQKINDDLNKISTYADDNNLKLNPSKCSFMLFAHPKKRQINQSEFDLKINGLSLSSSDAVKNLGLTFDNTLRFKEYVNLVLKKCYFGLKHLYVNKHILNFKTRKKLCEALLFPILAYYNIVYYSCLDVFTKNRLQKFQNSCCRFVFNLKKYDHVSDKINQLSWLRLDNAYQYHVATLTHKILTSQTPSYLYEKFACRRNNRDINFRYKKRLEIPFYTTSFFRRSFIYNAVKIYNEVDDTLKSLAVTRFKKRIKIHFLQSQY
nr:unnamed protein product [Callosobruchus chinensis]